MIIILANYFIYTDNIYRINYDIITRNRLENLLLRPDIKIDDYVYNSRRQRLTFPDLRDSFRRRMFENGFHIVGRKHYPYEAGVYQRQDIFTEEYEQLELRQFCNGTFNRSIFTPLRCIRMGSRIEILTVENANL